MIKKVRIQKFMSVDNVTLEFGDINVFVGPTDSGKSVVMRALQAVITNQFPAARYASHGEPKYAVAIVTESGVVQLLKSKSTQYQVITNKDGELHKEQFNAVGRDIPLEAKKVLNMPLLPLSDTETLEVLYQSQHKPFFLITEDRATFSKVIALISNADKLRELEKLANSDILSTKRTITQLKDSIVDYDRVIATKEVYISSLKDFSGLSSDVDASLKEAREVQDKILKLKELASVNDNIELLSVKSSLESFNLEAFDKSFNSATKVVSLKEYFEQSTLDVPSFVQVPEFAKIQISYLAKVFNESIIETSETIAQPNFMFAQISELTNLVADLSKDTLTPLDVPEFVLGTVREIRESILEIIELELNLDALHDLKVEIDSSLSEFDGATCPVCGNIITKEHLLSE